MKVTVNRLVWVREVAHEAGTSFEIVADPKKPREVDDHQVARWRQEGWLKDATRSATEGA